MKMRIHPSEVDNAVEFDSFVVTQETRNNVLNMTAKMPQRQLKRRLKKVA